MPDQPPQDFGNDGARSTGRVRLRTIFLGFVVLEQLYEYRDGRRIWRRVESGTLYPIASRSEPADTTGKPGCSDGVTI